MYPLIKDLLFSYFMELSDGGYTVATTGIPDGWFHLVVRYLGDGKGMKIYYDGNEGTSLTNRHGSTPKTSSRGNIVLGRQYTDTHERYASVMVDELTLWDN